jgi:hypothetical protein
MFEPDRGRPRSTRGARAKIYAGWVTSRVDLDLPPAGYSLPLSGLERFVEHARHAGAVADTAVIAVAADQDPDMTVALRVEFDSLTTEHAEGDDLLELLAEIERSDGDINAQRRAILELRQRLTKHAE